MDKATDKIFVTGGAGLVGGELVKQLLAEGYHVRALCHQSKIETTHPNLEIFQGDLLDIVFLEDILKNITHVFHCAALISYHPADQYRLMKINVEGTANIVNACLENNIKKIVYVSSVAAIGRTRKNEPVTEKLQWTKETNSSFYGKSKFLAEMEVWRGAGEGLDSVIVNPSIIMGGENWDSGSSAIFKKAYEEFPWYSEGVGGWVGVQDVARAMILLMNSAVSRERFILSSENLSYREVFTMIAKYFGRKPPHLKVTPFLAEIVWRAAALKSWISGSRPVLTKETARASLIKTSYDNAKILEALPGFSFTPLSDVIEQTCKLLMRKYIK